MDDILLEGISLGRQVSRETCWASTVVAVGQSVRPEISTNAAALVVAEGIVPNLREDDIDAKKAYEDAKNKDLKEAEKLIEENKKSLKETRDPKIMLEKHFGVVAIEEEFSTSDHAGRADILRIFIETMRQGHPMILGVTPTCPLLRKEGAVERKAPTSPMHTLLCYGVTGIGGVEPSVLCQDPAAPHGARNLTLPLSQLLDGFVYIEKANLGAKFKAEFSNENVSMRLSRILRTTKYAPG